MSRRFCCSTTRNLVHIPAAAAGTLLLVARLLDAVIDLSIGSLVDRTQTRWGRTRPYLLFSPLPFAVFVVLTFAVPAGIAPIWQLVWGYVTYNILGILYSFGSIPFSAMMPMISSDPNVRIQLGALRSFNAAITVILATVFTVPLVHYFGGGDDRKGYGIVAGVVGLMAFLMMTNTFLFCRERFKGEPRPPLRFFDQWRSLRVSRAWQVCLAFATLNFVRFGVLIAGTTYFCLAVLHRPWMISVLLPCVSGTLAIGSILAPPLLKRFGIRGTCQAAILAAMPLTAALPFFEAQPIVFIALFVTASVLLSLTMTAIFTMSAECVEYHEWKTGWRDEGMLAAGIAVAIKIGMAIGTSLLAYGLALGHYTPGHVTSGARLAIRMSFYGWPLMVYALQLAVIRYWPVDRPPAERVAVG